MPLLLGLTGPAGAGKDTVGKRLYMTHNFVNTSFAEPLRCAAMEVFGLDYDHFIDRELKETVNGYWGLTPRQMLQRLGTEAIRGTFGPEFWVRRWCQTYAEVHDTDHIVVTDVRFPEEAQMVRERGGVLVHILRDDVTRFNHASDQGIPFLAGDHVIENDGDIKGLYAKVDSLMSLLDA